MTEGTEQLLLHFLEQIACGVNRVAVAIEESNSYMVSCEEAEFKLPELDFDKGNK